MAKISRAQKLTEIPANGVQIRFSAKVQETLRKLEQAVIEPSPHFDSDVKIMLRELRTEEPQSLEVSLMHLAIVVREATQLSERTGNEEVAHEVSNLIGDLISFYKDPRPFTVVVKPQMRTLD